MALPLSWRPRRLARWWPWAGSAPRRRWTGASSGTSSWPGSSRCLWPACSAPPSWPCSSTASCPLCEGTRVGRESRGRRESERERERERRDTWVTNGGSSVRVAGNEEQGGKRARVTAVQRLVSGLGCTVDVRRVGSYAAWLRSPEICFDSF